MCRSHDRRLWWWVFRRLCTLKSYLDVLVNDLQGHTIKSKMHLQFFMCRVCSRFVRLTSPNMLACLQEIWRVDFKVCLWMRSVGFRRPWCLLVCVFNLASLKYLSELVLRRANYKLNFFFSYQAFFYCQNTMLNPCDKAFPNKKDDALNWYNFQDATSCSLQQTSTVHDRKT
jgi:hypothetical protein